MNGSLTILSLSDDLETIVGTLTPLLKDARKRGDDDISPVARGLVASLMGHRPDPLPNSAEQIYIVSIAAEVANPGTPGLTNRVNQLWTQARACADFSPQLLLDYIELRIEVHRIRAQASNARMSPARRAMHERCLQEAKRLLNNLVPA